MASTVKSAKRVRRAPAAARLRAAARRELRRWIKDAEDPRRFLLVAGTLPHFSLYYLMHDDTWAMDDPREATLFRRREAAESIRALLKRGVFVVPCRVDRRGRLVLSSIAGRRAGRVRLAVRPRWRERKKKGAGVGVAA